MTDSSSSSSSSGSDGNESKTVQIYFLCFSGILILVLFLAKFLEDTPSLRRYLSEPAMTLLLGIFFSFLVRILNEESYEEYQVHYEEEYNAESNYEDFNEDALADQYMGDLPQFFLFFPNNVFFMALLPPILFNSGYQLQRELFYRHFSPIALYSCVGTCIAAVGSGGFLILMKQWGLMGDFDPSNLELMTFGALIAATDTVSVVGVLQRKRVDPHLFSLVFGESALNDAVAIVLFKTLAEFLKENHHAIYGTGNGYANGGYANNNNNEDGDAEESLGIKIGKYLLDLLIQAVLSPIIGLLFAGVMSLAFKQFDMREHRLLELSLYILPVYIPFILAEILELSGMITIFTTGIFARRYMEPNVSAPTREYAGILFQLLSFLAETCIFLELGLSVFGLHKSYYFGFISLAFVAALLGRALSVYPLSCLYNFSLTRPVPTTMGFAVMDDTTTVTTTTCGADSAVVDVDTPLGDYQLASKDGIIIEATKHSIQHRDTAANISTGIIGNGDDGSDGSNDSAENHNATESDKTYQSPNPFQMTLNKTSNCFKDLRIKRETPVRKRDKVIPLKFMHILWFAGLRGAVAYACAREFPDVNGNKNAFIAATMCIVLVTIVLMGGATESLMECLNIRMNVDNDEYMKIWHKQRRLKGKFLHFEYNYIYRFVVRDTNVNFMDESCGHLQQVDDTEVFVHGIGRRLRSIPNLNGATGMDGSSSIFATGSVRTTKRTNKSLLDDPEDELAGPIRRVRMEDDNDDDGRYGYGGDLQDELQMIQAQLNSGSHQQIRTTLSNASSFDSGKFNWDVACKL
ncbi:sodium/hydrogen exchanger [Nitzschia inconspicua]|uniref:Sodium/hydrogen exchanger n=1 Tax=Nitzschia inconspicua TaxID=303405 RepID=A0A9K3KHY5_9STRA|nr:sodium/hydrogen exchanger [Nitzschia inconspicua]KAG7343561.1 sodium/hydrogen exchanger [Nitzschia inconspicua]